MATDFFFILSGVLFYYSFKRRNGKYSLKDKIQYIWRKYIGFEKCVIISEVVLLSASLGFWGLNKKELCREMLLLEIFVPDSSYRFNPPLWYLGYLLLGMVLLEIFFCIRKQNEKICISTYAGISVLLYSILLLEVGHGNIYPQYNAVFDWKPLWRCLCGLLIGCLLGMRKKDSLLHKKFRLPIFMLLFSLDSYFFLWRDGYTVNDLGVYCLIVINIYVAINTQVIFNEIIIANIIYYLGKVSLIVYVIHYPIVRLVANREIFDGMNWKMYSFIFLVIVWSCAIIAQLMAKGSCQLFINNMQKGIAND